MSVYVNSMVSHGASGAPGGCFRFPICCSVSKRDRLNWSRKSTSSA